MVTARQDDEIDLATAALLIAAVEYPDLDIDQQLAILDSLAEGAAYRIGRDRDPFHCVNNLSEYLFDEVGFQGNQGDYYDPRNSYLNEVLQRRTGLPITLCLVCLEVGKRLDIPLVGVGLPGHFVLSHRSQTDLIIDPFRRGILLSEEECAQILKNVLGANVDWDSRYLTPASNREFIARILRNLKGIYLNRRDHEEALDVVDITLALRPDDLNERRDRGLIYYRLGHYQMALDDLRHFLTSAPAGTDTSNVEKLVGYIEERQGG
jgi:regulator of sirC expression with transglutaminase-like and TPR domain